MSISFSCTCRRRVNQVADLPFASVSQLLNYALRQHALSTKLGSLVDKSQESVLSLLTDEHYVPDINHQCTYLEFRFETGTKRV
jgi:hypothetical protein